MAVAAANPADSPVHVIGRAVIALVEHIGSIAVFTGRAITGIFQQPPRASVLWPTLYQVGVQSLLVIMTTGAFIGMVLAVQMFTQLRLMRMETQIGAVINISLVKELGPVLAAVMLAGRVGSSMAAELGTMRVTEQIDALVALGANPIHYLVGPRLLACFLLIPALTLIADGMGILSGWLFSTQFLGIDSHHYWHHASNLVTGYDVLSGVFKSVFFGASIAVLSCHRGFHSRAGAEGVGRAATEAFVYSFVMILLFDLVLGMILAPLYYMIY